MVFNGLKNRCNRQKLDNVQNCFFPLFLLLLRILLDYEETSPFVSHELAIPRYAPGPTRRDPSCVRLCNRVCSECIASKRDEITCGVTSIHSSSKDLLMSYMDVDTTKYKLLNPGDDKFLRDMILSFMLAGRDTTGSALTWFFWLLSKNPEVTTKIRQEINTKLSPRTNNDSDHFSSFNPQDLNKLVYLHGALCEALRLYPPVPFQHKSPTKPDVLPSGHRVDASTKIVFCLYSLGRMKSLWGEDASEFKPERWISETGRLIHVPSFKFLSFNAGPRTCLGKEVAMTQMKTVAVKVIQNYEIEIVEGHKIEPVPSIILHMKQGLKVMVTKRCNLV
ncbi:hypothetical protein YC2023_103393 [Brassica napus]